MAFLRHELPPANSTATRCIVPHMEAIYQLVFIFTALFLVLLNGFFVNAEFSIVKVRETRIQELIRRGNERAKTVLKLIDNMDEYLSATQLGITLASLGLGWDRRAGIFPNCSNLCSILWAWPITPR